MHVQLLTVEPYLSNKGSSDWQNIFALTRFCFTGQEYSSIIADYYNTFLYFRINSQTTIPPANSSSNITFSKKGATSRSENNSKVINWSRYCFSLHCHRTLPSSLMMVRLNFAKQLTVVLTFFKRNVSGDMNMSGAAQLTATAHIYSCNSWPVFVTWSGMEC